MLVAMERTRRVGWCRLGRGRAGAFFATGTCWYAVLFGLRLLKVRRRSSAKGTRGRLFCSLDVFDFLLFFKTMKIRQQTSITIVSDAEQLTLRPKTRTSCRKRKRKRRRRRRSRRSRTEHQHTTSSGTTDNLFGEQNEHCWWADNRQSSTKRKNPGNPGIMVTRRGGGIGRRRGGGAKE